MTTMTHPLLSEFKGEAATTKRVLERVPVAKLTWKPHPKSMTLGQLAWHVAAVPGAIAKILRDDSFDVSKGTFVPPQPESIEEIMAAYEASVHDAEEFLQSLTDARASAAWHLLRNGQELFAQPRLQVVRSLMFSHAFHHRGQLSVYLRLLDVPLPSIYGPSADESPFG